MKRILSVLLAITFIFTLVACGNKADTSSDIDTFVKPKNYATVLLVTINPQFKLYLDDQNKVLAVEPVNDDAKSVIKDTTFDGELENVIEKIVGKSNDAGFVKQNATIDFKITENKNETINTEDLLNTVKDTANSVCDKINIKIEINLSIAEGISSSLDKQDTSSLESVSSDLNIQDSPNSTESNESAAATIHKHSFLNATCTAPKTCSCGTTEGNALGHNFKDGKCTVCNTLDPSYKYTSLNEKKGTWVAEYVLNGNYYSFGLNATETLSIGVTIGDPLSSMEQEVQDDIRKNKDQPGYKESYRVYQGNEYWCGRGSGAGIKPILENDNTITITALEEDEAQIVFTRTDENTLTVKSVTQTFKDMVEDIPVGTKISFKG